MKYEFIEEINDTGSHGKLLSQIRPNSTVLECGCAGGYMTKYMKEQLNCRVYIIEYDREGFDSAKQYAEDGICADLTKDGWYSKFRGMEFDYILLADVLEHLPDPLAVLQKAATLLKESGTVLVSLPNIGHNDVVVKLLQGNWDYTATGLLDDTHIHFWGINNLAAFFQKAGLHITVLDATTVPTMHTEQYADGQFPADENIYAVIKDRREGEVFQFILTLQRTEYVKSNGIAFVDRIPEKGSESLEAPTVQALVDARLADCEAHIRKQNELLETTMENYRALENDYKKNMESFNLRISDLRRSNTELEQNIVQDKKAYEKLQAEKKTADAELAACKEQVMLALRQRDDLKTQLALAQFQFDAISNSTFWKLTLPLQHIIDAVKDTLYMNRYTRLLGKGIMSLFRNGFKATWNKVRNKLRTHFGKAPLPLPIPAVQEPFDPEKLEEIPQVIKFSVLVPLYNTSEGYLREMIQSVRDQVYGNWELCLADGSDPEHSYVEQVCREYAQADPRIRYQRLAENRGISENTNACAQMATGDYIALLDHDDIYTPDALYFNAKAILETNADVLYSDEDHLALDGSHVNPFYKPDWSPDLLYSQMYICHLLVFRRSLFEKIGGYRKEFDGSQDYDLMLRFSEETDKICHIPRILYSWRESETSTAANASAKPYAHTAGKNALDAHLKRKFGPKARAEETEYLFVFSPRFHLDKAPLASIIIPMKDHWEMTDACIKSIFEKTTYPNYEIIILNNRSQKADTYAWFEKVKQENRVRVIDADMEFNWSKINNFGIRHAKGDVFVFLNNDTLVISPDWLDRLAENALRPDVGVVGGLLLYEDNTIQHAGVVVGINGWADHVFKGMAPVHYGAPFVSPMVSRNVLAVTGACMAVSRATLEKIGTFDESFIICGSDVELCIRAHDHALYNRYDVNVRLYHLESKSRDSYIPEVDFQKSYEAYGPYRENIDPYFNINLDITSVIPREKVAPMNLVNFKNFLKRSPLIVDAYHALQRAMVDPSSYAVAEIGPLNPRTGKSAENKKRLNLLVPSVDKAHVFGGISTALKFYESMAQSGDFFLRIITLDAPVRAETCVLSKDYAIVKPEEDPAAPKQVLPMADRHNRTFPVSENDVFVATSWWSAYVIQDVLAWQETQYGKAHPLVYLIQDYEPGFYPWSSRYMMADSTYRSERPVYAVLNSKLLHDHFSEKGYRFAKKWYFEPTLNESLRGYLPDIGTVVPKKKQILVYGRPDTARNAFELIVYALKEWAAKQEDIAQWTILSAGEQHNDVELGNGAVLRSVGKLSLEDYAKMMLDTYAGVSLMVSPHPSYPPLEMATFGVKTITNRYDSKDLSSFSDNMVSLSACAPRNIAAKLLEICGSYDGQGVIHTSPDYLKQTAVFGDIPQQICAVLAADPADT